ncbi:MAG: hypothetical protein AAF363_06755 [Bacteroidota bacterium]
MRIENNQNIEQAIESTKDPNSLHERLNECNDRLRYENEKVDEYAHINSHQMRGPIARVQGLVNLLYNSHSKIDVEEILEYIKISAEELDQMTRVISERLSDSNSLEDCRKCA